MRCDHFDLISVRSNAVQHDGQIFLRNVFDDVARCAFDWICSSFALNDVLVVFDESNAQWQSHQITTSPSQPTPSVGLRSALSSLHSSRPLPCTTEIAK